MLLVTRVRFVEAIPAFFSGKIMALFQIWGEVPVAKLQLKISSSSLFARGPSALRKVGGMSSGPGAPFDLSYRTARSSSYDWNGRQHASSTVGDLRTSFNRRMRLLSVLLKFSRLTAA